MEFNNIKSSKKDYSKVLLDSMPEMVEIIELIYSKEGQPIDFYIRDVNLSFAQLFNKTKEELINKKITSVAGIVEDYWLTSFASVDKTGQAIRFKSYGAEFDKHYFVSAWKIEDDKIGVSFTCITESEKAKIALKEKIEKEKKARIEKEQELTEKSFELLKTVDKLDKTVKELSFQSKEKDKQAEELEIIRVKLEEQNFCLNKVAILTETDADSNITFVNDNFCKIYGYQRDELVGKTHRILKSGKQPDSFFTLMMQTIYAGKTFKDIVINKDKGGKNLFWMDLTIIPLKDLNGNIVKFLSVMFDITAQIKQKETLLKHSEELAKANKELAFKNAEKDQKVEELARAMYTLSFQNEEKDRYTAELATAKEEKEQRANELIIANKELAYQNKEKDKRANELIIANKEKEKRAEELAVARELKQFIETSRTPVFGVDNSGLINEWNQAAEKITGYKKNEVLGANWAKFTPIVSNKSVGRVLNLALKEKQTSNFEFFAINKSGKEVVLLINTRTVRNALGQVTGVLAVGQDITTLVSHRNKSEKKVKERTIELNEALEEQKELNKSKSKFISTASHEFRTPLSAINFAAGTIKKHWSNMEPLAIEKKMHKIEQQVHFMVRLLDDILIIGAASAGKLENNPLPMHLGNFIEDIIDEVYISTDKSHEIELIDSEQLRGTTLLIDEKLGRSIFINIISNAIKYSPNGRKISIELSTEEKYILISVTDFGIGISPKELKNLFTPFSRGKNVDLIQGTGLGLSIAKEAIDIMKGKIVVRSTVGKGTSFTVKILKKKRACIKF